jgi:hypothetical protein
VNLELLLVAAVVVVRLVAPLAILRYPLPGLVFSAFVIDSVDRDAYHAYLDITEMQYQRFDKALDTYYLCFAYLAMLRHWKSPTAVTIGRALFFYRLIGVAVFELTGLRWMLAAFPNAYEFFFLFYEAVRLRWRVERLTPRGWAVAAGVITAAVLVKEVWVHVLIVDTATLVTEHLTAAVIVLTVAVALAAIAWMRVRHRLPPPDGRASWRVRTEVRDGSLPLHALPARREPRTWLRATEAFVLVSLISVIAIEGTGRSADLRIVLPGALALLVLHSLLGTVIERTPAARRSTFGEFALLLAVNGAVVTLTGLALAALGVDLDPLSLILFVVPLTFFLVLYERSLLTRERGSVSSPYPRAPGRAGAHR